MMSWGDSSRFTIRDTRREPTKSAVIGLLCAALGRPRHKPVDDLARLKMGVRVNQEGVVLCDYHTVQEGIKSSGGSGKTVVSRRYYIADADYLVGLEGSDLSFLDELNAALGSPVWPLYLGRKSFIPSCPVQICVDDRPLRKALHYDQIKRPAEVIKKLPDELRCVIEVSNSSEMRQDVPINWENRLFGSRYVDSNVVIPKNQCFSPS